MIKLIILDLTGVILTGGHKKLCQILGAKYGLDPDKVYEIIYTKYFNRFALNQLSEIETYEGPIKGLGLKESWQDLADMYLNTHALNEPMADYAQELRRRCSVIILTKNIPRYLAWEREKFGLDSLVDGIIDTSVLNLPKAGKETIEYVLNKFQVSPTEAIYVDDQESNLEEAKKMGVHTIFYKDFSNVKETLNNLLK